MTKKFKAIAFGNRSAAFYSLEKFNESLIDTYRAQYHGLSSSKLFVRRQNCFTQISNSDSNSFNLSTQHHKEVKFLIEFMHLDDPISLQLLQTNDYSSTNSLILSNTNGYRSLKSNEYTRKGTLLIHESPFAYQLKHNENQCIVCGSTSSAYIISFSIRYCSEPCKRLNVIGKFGNHTSISDPLDFKLALQILNIIELNGKSDYYYLRSIELINLQGKVSTLSQETIESTLELSIGYDLSKDHFLKLLTILSKLHRNSITISKFSSSQILMNNSLVDEISRNNIGVGVYLQTSMLNHSCKPNAIVEFDGVDVKVWASEDISEGDEVFISYIAVCGNVYFRRKLLEKWGFVCQCTRCLTEVDGTVVEKRCNNDVKLFQYSND